MDDAPIFGLDKDLDECDWLYAHLDESLRHEDLALFGLKWFDYRSEHPIHSTYRFAQAYRVAYKEAFRANFDRERAEYVSGVKAKHEDIFELGRKGKANQTGFVRARQHADLLGMPYLEYTRIAFSWATRRSRDYLPRPCHLYSFDLLTAIQETWRERQAGMVFVASDPLFRNEAYQGLEVQNAHHEWLLQQATLRPNAHHYLARVLYEDDVLLESKVEARFGRDVLERARATMH